MHKKGRTGGNRKRVLHQSHHGSKVDYVLEKNYRNPSKKTEVFEILTKNAESLYLSEPLESRVVFQLTVLSNVD